MIDKSEALRNMEKNLGVDADEIPRLIEIFKRDDEDVFIVSKMTAKSVPLFLLWKLFPDCIANPKELDEPLFGGYPITKENIPHIYPYLHNQTEIFNFKKYEYFLATDAGIIENYRQQKESDPEVKNKFKFKSETRNELEARLGFSADNLSRRIMIYNNDWENFYLIKEIPVKPIAINLLQQLFPESLEGKYSDTCLIDSYEITKNKIPYLVPYLLSETEVFSFDRYQYFLTVAELQDCLINN